MQHAFRCTHAPGAAYQRRQLAAAAASARPDVRRPVQRLRSSQQGSDIAPTGQITNTLIDSMTGNIREALEAQKVQIVDVYGDGRHVAIDVVSELFDGKSSMQRQRMVYKAIWVELQEAVHAVDSMTTLTPAEAGL